MDPEVNPRSKAQERILTAILVGQAAALLAVIGLQPGFDHRAGPLNLDFDFVVQMVWCFALLWIAGAVLSWRYWDRRKCYLIIHTVTSPLFIFAALGGYLCYLQ